MTNLLKKLLKREKSITSEEVKLAFRDALSSLWKNARYSVFFWLFTWLSLSAKSICLIYEIYGAGYSKSIWAFAYLSVVTSLFIISVCFLLPYKGRAIYLLCVNTFVSVLFIVDAVYERAYFHLIGIYMMQAGEVLEGLNDGVLSLVKATDFLFLIDIPIFLLFIIFTKFPKGDRKIWKRLPLFLISIISTSIIICTAYLHYENIKALGNYRNHPLFMSPLGNHIYDVYCVFADRHISLGKNDTANIINWFDENAKNQDPAEKYEDLAGILKGKNIIAIQFESLEGFVIGLEYNGVEITPELNKILESSIYFCDIIEQTRDGNSSDAELLFLTSMYPISRGATMMRFGQNTYNSLPTLLGKHGYTAIAIHGDDKDYWNRDQAFPILGFDDYIDEEKFIYKEYIGMGLSDAALFKQSVKEISALAEAGDPYFSFIITLTSHMPFNLNASLRNTLLPFADATDRYLQTINYADACLGDFIDTLEKKELLENTAIVIYGDHEGLHKYYGSEKFRNDMRLPFIVYIPGFDGITVENSGGEIDMMPTLLYLLGIPSEKYDHTVMGRNLLGDNTGSAIFTTGLFSCDAPSGRDLLDTAFGISDLCIKSNYFSK